MPNISIKAQPDGELLVVSEMSRGHAGPMLREVSRSIQDSAIQEHISALKEGNIEMVPDEDRYEEDINAIIEVTVENNTSTCNFRAGRTAPKGMSKFDFIMYVTRALEEAGHHMLLSTLR